MSTIRSILIYVALISLANQVSSNKVSDKSMLPSSFNLILYLQVNGNWLTDIQNQISSAASLLANMTGSQDTWASSQEGIKCLQVEVALKYQEISNKNGKIKILNQCQGLYQCRLQDAIAGNNTQAILDCRTNLYNSTSQVSSL